MKLNVSGFTCLKKIEIEFDSLTILIGEQASGKSITCKLYYFFREVFSDSFSESIIDGSGIANMKQTMKKKFYDLFPSTTWKNQKFSIQFSSNSNKTEPCIHIAHEIGANSIALEFSDELKSLYRSIKKKFDIGKKDIEESDNVHQYRGRSYLLSDIVKNLPDNKLLEDVVYIPSGRAFFATIKDNLFGFISKNIGIDPFLTSFGEFYEFSKFVYQRDDKKKSDIFENAMKEIVKGTYSRSNKEESIVSDKNQSVPLAHASSGQQEALPLLLVLQALQYSKSSLDYPRTAVVEEPEAHLFPSSQKAMVELLYATRNSVKDLRIIVTTHSPYVLSCFNNELLKDKDNSHQVKAYYISDGSAKQILDHETGLIDGIDLDRVGSEISEEFFSLLGDADEI